jgi:glycosyltransferase involved in cell wall biosynthesis
VRVLHVVPTYLPAVRYGGPMFAVQALCSHLAALGHDMHVYTTNLDGDGVLQVPLGRAVELDGVKVHYFAADRLRRLAVSAGLRNEIERQLRTFDLVHTHSVFLWPPWHAARAARTRGVPYVMAPHGMLVPELLRLRNRLAKTLWLRLLERSNLADANALHFTSELERRDARRLGIAVTRGAVIPNGVSLEEARGEPGHGAQLDDGAPPFALHLGRISWKKGLDRLVRALASRPEVHAVIAGNDEEGCRASLQRLAQKCGVADRVHFPGPVYGAAKWKLLREARLFVLPSHSENFGIAVLEAMAAGRPVIVSPGVGLADAVRRSDCGMVVDAEPDALAKALGELWGDEARRRSMGDRGRALVEREYTWPRIARQMEELYHSILRR